MTFINEEVITMSKTPIPPNTDSRLLARVAEEGYGPGAWHGADMKAALADVPAELAFWRPAPGRHNIAEIALHHAWCARSVRGQLTGTAPEPFILEGEDWFPVDGGNGVGWEEILTAVDDEQRRLAAAVAGVGKGDVTDARFEVVLGVTCHAIYHAGQVQLIKRLRAD